MKITQTQPEFTPVTITLDKSSDLYSFKFIMLNYTDDDTDSETYKFSEDCIKQLNEMGL